MYLHKNYSHTWKRRGDKYVQVFFKRGGMRSELVLLFSSPPGSASTSAVSQPDRRLLSAAS